MQASYGYEDGAGRFYITVDTDLCNGCGDCVPACPAGVLEMVEEDPLEDTLVAAVSDEHRKKIKYSCNPCKNECSNYYYCNSSNRFGYTC